MHGWPLTINTTNTLYTNSKYLQRRGIYYSKTGSLFWLNDVMWECTSISNYSAIIGHDSMSRCLLIIFQYEPICLQFSSLSNKRSIRIWVAYTHYTQLTISTKWEDSLVLICPIVHLLVPCTIFVRLSRLSAMSSLSESELLLESLLSGGFTTGSDLKSTFDFDVDGLTSSCKKMESCCLNRSTAKNV